jgi:hypothetical protein
MLTRLFAAELARRVDVNDEVLIGMPENLRTILIEECDDHVRLRHLCVLFDVHNIKEMHDILTDRLWRDAFAKSVAHWCRVDVSGVQGICAVGTSCILAGKNGITRITDGNVETVYEYAINVAAIHLIQESVVEVLAQHGDEFHITPTDCHRHRYNRQAATQYAYLGKGVHAYIKEGEIVVDGHGVTRLNNNYTLSLLCGRGRRMACMSHPRVQAWGYAAVVMVFNVYQLQAQPHLLEFTRIESTVSAMCFIDEDTLLVGFSNGIILKYGTQMADLLEEIDTGLSDIACIVSHPPRLAVASFTDMIKIWHGQMVMRTIDLWQHRDTDRRRRKNKVKVGKRFLSMDGDRLHYYEGGRDVFFTWIFGMPDEDAKFMHSKKEPKKIKS